MTIRLNYPTLAPQAYQALVKVSGALTEASVGRKLIDLVYQRVSQLNGCAYCVDLHARDLLAQGEDLQRLNSLTTWHETTFFDARERAALAWAEATTQIRESRAPDELFEDLRAHFTDQEIAELTMAASLMNAWNRIAIGFRQPVKQAPLAA